MMLYIISSAKTMDFEKARENIVSKPLFQSEAQNLVEKLQTLSKAELAEVLGVSEKLTLQNYQRYQDFGQGHKLQAMLAYYGDVYKGLEISNYKDLEYQFAHNHLRIISGLYGYLRAMDEIAPYRLEMSSNLEGVSLYKIWGEKISNSLKIEKPNYIINLASEEYIKAIHPEKFPDKMINIIFKQNHHGQYKVIGLEAKRARGKMVNFAILNKINAPIDLQEFSQDGYKFSPSDSNDNNYVFLRT